MNFSKTKKLLHSFKVIHTNGSTNSYFKNGNSREEKRKGMQEGKKKIQEKKGEGE